MRLFNTAKKIETTPDAANEHAGESGIDHGPAIKAIRDFANSPAMQVLRDYANSPEIKAMAEGATPTDAGTAPGKT